VTHPSQLGNPFLGLPLEAGKCESCGASENDKCEGTQCFFVHNTFIQCALEISLARTPFPFVNN
jgi:hypothetical protein